MSAYVVVDGHVDGLIQLVKRQIVAGIAGQDWLNFRPAVEHQQSVDPELFQAVRVLVIKAQSGGTAALSVADFAA